MKIKNNLCFITEESVASNRHRMKKTDPFAIDIFTTGNVKMPGLWYSPLLSPCLEGGDIKRSSFRVGDEFVSER